jgi:hypothetical protein
MAVGDAIRSYAGLQRMAIVGAGACHTGSGHHFDRWFLERLERGELDQVLDMPDGEIELAGNGTHEMRSRLAVAGGAEHSHHPRVRVPVYPWITGMGVAQWENTVHLRRGVRT